MSSGMNSCEETMWWNRGALEMAEHSLRPILILITALQVQRRAIEDRRKREKEAGNLKVESIVSSLRTQTVPVTFSVLAT